MGFKVGDIIEQQHRRGSVERYIVTEESDSDRWYKCYDLQTGLVSLVDTMNGCGWSTKAAQKNDALLIEVKAAMNANLARYLEVFNNVNASL